MLVASLATACAGLVPHRDQPPGVTEGAPDGLYALTVHVRGIGPFCGTTTALIAAEPTQDGFRANSRPGAAGELLGGLGGLYLDWIGDSRVPGGAFLHWRGPAPGGDEAVRGVFETPRADLHADFHSHARPIELRPLDDERLFGLITLAPARATDYPTGDYPALIERIDALLREHLFDAQAYEARGTRSFLKDLHRSSHEARDEAELVMAWMLASRHLDFSHCYLGRELDPEFADELAETSSISPHAEGLDSAIEVTYEEGLATLRIESFEGFSYDGIDGAFDDIVGNQPRGLIIDLRGNPGGTYISGRVAAHLVRSDVKMGVFFDRRARARVLAGELGEFPCVTSINSEEEFTSLIGRHGAFVGTIEPIEPVYDGPVVVLVDGATASACEPLVAGLQELGRATIVGERTAGALLWTDPLEVGDGWLLWIPTVDYLTGRGARLEELGVVPDVKTSSEEAARTAGDLLSQHS